MVVFGPGLAAWIPAFEDRTYQQWSFGDEVPESGDRFGAALASHSAGRVVVIGVAGEDLDGAPDVGTIGTLEVGLFLDETTWSQADPQIADATESGDRFGGALP